MNTPNKKPGRPAVNADKTLILTYFRTLAAIVCVFGFFLALGFSVYFFLAKKVESGLENSRQQTDAAADISPEGPVSAGGGKILGSVFSVPDKTNFIIIGTDASGLLTDVIIAGCFDKNSGVVSLVSVPRDTYCVLSADTAQTLRDAGRSVPQEGGLKINSINAIAGREFGFMFLIKQVEALLGVGIDYYAVISLEAFRDIVDKAGGVYMDVPKGGLFYEDDAQDLYINVPEGRALLDGKSAEGLVRFRSAYPNGDIGRIEMQHEFIKQFAAQTLSRENIIKNAADFISVFLNYVDTNVTLGDALKYFGYIGALNADSIVFYTLQGSPGTIGDISYYFLDPEKTAEIADAAFKTVVSENPAGETAALSGAPPDIKKQKIQILNATGEKGLAGEKSAVLGRFGFNVINTGDYETDAAPSKTTITVRAAGDYSEITKHFAAPSVTANPRMSGVYDIVIILGTDEIHS